VGPVALPSQAGSHRRNVRRSRNLIRPGTISMFVIGT
jgi:hypothetical protein